MAQGDLVLYLVLSPEFGGTRFGPFEGLEARLGSNKERCHITLPESLGVAKEHCKVIRQGGASMILAPSERTAAVFLWKGDARRPVQVQAPTAVKPGDSFALVTPEGPRFYIELGDLPAEMKAARSPAKRGPKNLTAGKFGRAGWDLFLARIYTFSPVSMAMRGLYFVKSGAIWQPRILILGAIMLFGYFSTGVSACTAFKFKSDANAAVSDAEECRENLKYAESVGSDVENFAFDELAITVTGVRSIGLAMKKDTAFVGLVKAQAKKILDNPESYAWLYEESNRPEEFAKWRERVEKSDAFDPDTKRLLPYLAATRGRVQGQWDKVLDSKETEVCVRGPARLTYRQAKNLGIAQVQLDAYVSGDATSIAQDDVARTQLLSATANAAGEPVLDTNVPSAAEVIRQGERTCVRADGDDDRESLAKVVTALEDTVGKASKFVPDVDSPFVAVSRLAKVFSADIPGAKFVGVSKSPLDFTKQSPTVALGDTAGGDWAVERTAEVIARAIVLPCDAVLNGDKKRMEATFGKLPSPVPCLVLNYRLTHEGG
ncbi:MAG: hypothetical protein Q8P41_04600 [Pseudomonadota bacterium]|nr:hypothetical protein [Pseudomonadota bacterium]